MIIGDSIAVGTAQTRPECVSYAKSGWNSVNWNRDYLAKASAQPARIIVVSLGANDHRGIKSEIELRKMRESIKGDRVFWIDPGQDRKPGPHDAIVRIAQEYGDTVIARPLNHMSADGVHPTGRGYKILGEQAK
jgi:lysophospholipase L1-like esterase